MPPRQPSPTYRQRSGRTSNAWLSNPLAITVSGVPSGPMRLQTPPRSCSRGQQRAGLSDGVTSRRIQSWVYLMSVRRGLFGSAVPRVASEVYVLFTVTSVRARLCRTRQSDLGMKAMANRRGKKARADPIGIAITWVPRRELWLARAYNPVLSVSCSMGLRSRMPCAPCASQAMRRNAIARGSEHEHVPDIGSALSRREPRPRRMRSSTTRKVVWRQPPTRLVRRAARAIVLPELGCTTWRPLLVAATLVLWLREHAIIAGQSADDVRRPAHIMKDRWLRGPHRSGPSAPGDVRIRIAIEAGKELLVMSHDTVPGPEKVRWPPEIGRRKPSPTARHQGLENIPGRARRIPPQDQRGPSGWNHPLATQSVSVSPSWRKERPRGVPSPLRLRQRSECRRQRRRAPPGAADFRSGAVRIATRWQRRGPTDVGGDRADRTDTVRGLFAWRDRHGDNHPRLGARSERGTKV